MNVMRLISWNTVWVYSDRISPLENLILYDIRYRRGPFLSTLWNFNLTELISNEISNLSVFKIIFPAPQNG